MRAFKGIFSARHNPGFEYMDGQPCIMIMGRGWAIYVAQVNGSYQTFYDLNPETKIFAFQDDGIELDEKKLEEVKADLPKGLNALLGQDLKHLTVEFK